MASGLQFFWTFHIIILIHGGPEIPQQFDDYARKASKVDTQEGRLPSLFLTALYRRPAFFFLMEKKNLKRNFPQSKKKVGSKKSKSEK